MRLDTVQDVVCPVAASPQSLRHSLRYQARVVVTRQFGTDLFYLPDRRPFQYMSRREKAKCKDAGDAKARHNRDAKIRGKMFSVIESG